METAFKIDYNLFLEYMGKSIYTGVERIQPTVVNMNMNININIKKFLYIQWKLHNSNSQEESKIVRIMERSSYGASVQFNSFSRCLSICSN